MKDKFVNELLELLSDSCGGCNVQHKGCPCRTCFYALCDELGLSNKRGHEFWKVVLVLRGDYGEEEMQNYEETK